MAESYVKTIRRLPEGAFLTALRKLINLVVVQGLRSRELAHREKARKALVRIMQDLKPNFLFLICEDMKGMLQRGF